jgi:thermitase
MELFAGMYPFFYLLSLLGLVGWFYFKGSSYTTTMSRMFLLCFLVYLFSLAFSPGSTGYKLVILSRDFLLMAFVVTAFQMLSRKKVLYFGAMVVFLSIFFSVLFDRWDKTFNWVPGTEMLAEEYELIIKLKGDYHDNSIGVIKRRFDLDCRNIFISASGAVSEEKLIVCDVPEAREFQLDQVSMLLRMHPSVEWWEWNSLIQVDPMEVETVRPGDSESMGLLPNDPRVSDMWHFTALEYDKLHSLLAENEGLVAQRSLIAILDTGIDHLHEDLSENYFSIQPNYDGDPMGHGTHCAGIAAGVSNNRLGIASQSHDNSHFTVSSIRVLNERGFGTKKQILKGIFEAAEIGADVISLSLGGPSLGSTDKAYEKAVSYARDKGSIVVAAAGNAGKPARNFSPANVSGVICVGAVGPDLTLASFSNTPQGIKRYIAAPGVSLLSTLPDNKYQAFNGTSMATPVVASTIALMRSFNPELTTEAAYEIIYRNSRSTQTQHGEVSVLMPYRVLSDLLGG